MNETVAVGFHGCELLARKTDMGYLVALKPICQNIGIEYSGQVQRLKRQPWATVGMIPTVGADGRDRDMFAPTVRRSPCGSRPLTRIVSKTRPPAT